MHVSAWGVIIVQEGILVEVVHLDLSYWTTAECLAEVTSHLC